MLLKSLENKVRIKLRNQGFVLEKRVISSNPHHSGCYRILNLYTNSIETGENFDLTMEEVLNFINE